VCVLVGVLVVCIHLVANINRKAKTMDYTGKRTSSEVDLTDVDEINTKKLCVGDPQYCFPEQATTKEGVVYLGTDCDTSGGGQGTLYHRSITDVHPNSHTYIYNIGTTGSPFQNKQVRFNNVQPELATKIYISDIDANNSNRKAYLNSRDSTGNIEIVRQCVNDDKKVRYGYTYSLVTVNAGYTEFDVLGIHFTGAFDTNGGDILTVEIEGSGAGTQVPVILTPATFGQFQRNPSIASITMVLGNGSNGDASFQGFLASDPANGNIPQLVPTATSNMTYGDDGTYQQIVVGTSGTYKLGSGVVYRTLTGTAQIVWKFFINGVSFAGASLVEELSNFNDTRVTSWAGLIPLTQGDRIDIRVAEVNSSGEVITVSGYNLHLNLLETPGQASGAATALATTGDDVVVDSAGQPSAGQALIATSSTNATWQTLPSSGGGGGAPLSTFLMPPINGNTFVWNDTNEFFFCIGTNQTAVTLSKLTLWWAQVSASISFDFSFYTRDLNNAGTTGGASYIQVAGASIYSGNSNNTTGPRTYTFSPLSVPALTNQNALFIGIKFLNVGGATLQTYARGVEGTQSTFPGAGLVNPVASGNNLRSNPGAPTGAVQAFPYFQVY